MSEITTTDFSKFGYRERKMAEELLKASREQGFPEDFNQDGLNIMKTGNTYKYKNNEIIGVHGEKDFKVLDFPRFNIKVVITKTLKDSYGESWFNVYLIDEKFRIKPLNNLNEQIPLNSPPKDWDNYLLNNLISWVILRDYNYNIDIQNVEDNKI